MAPHLCDDVSAVAWFAPRLRGEFGAVGLTVPTGYEAYARIFHPAAERHETPVSWHAVSEVTAGKTYALMQWHALVGTSDSLNTRGSLWPGRDPERGNLSPEVQLRLCEVLAEHTATADHCYFCLWEAWGWIEDEGLVAIRARRRGSSAAMPFEPHFRLSAASPLGSCASRAFACQGVTACCLRPAVGCG